MGRRKMPNPKDLVDYNHAVAGHAGTLCDPDGTLFVKPCTQQEIDFYESARGQHREFYKWMPRHLGTLRLNETSEISDVNVQLGEVAALMSEHMKEEVVEFAHSHHPPPTDPPTGTATPTTTAEPIQPVSEIATPWAPGKNRKLTTEISIVLDNASYGFEAPNIMDCKLGLRLWADDAPPEKKKRFDRIAQETTHKTHGFRVAGMRTYKGSEDPEELDEEGYLKYDKDWGRLSVTPENVIDSMRRFLYNPAAGIDDDDAALVCELFVTDLVEIEKMLAAEESRMYSASLLFVCEGDGEALSVAIREAKAAAAEAAAKAAARAAAVAAVIERAAVVEGGRARKAAKTGAHSSPGWVSNNRIDSGIDMGEDDETLYEDDKVAGGAIVFATDGVLFAGDGSDSEDGSSDSDEDYEDEKPNGAKTKKAKKDKFKKIYSLRLIDFAHAEWVPGQGPDENVLLGVRSLIEIFREMPKRTAELKLAAEQSVIKSAATAELPVGST